MAIQLSKKTLSCMSCLYVFCDQKDPHFSASLLLPLTILILLLVEYASILQTTFVTPARQLRSQCNYSLFPSSSPW